MWGTVGSRVRAKEISQDTVNNAENGEENAGSREVRELRPSSTASSFFTKGTFYNAF